MKRLFSLLMVLTLAAALCLPVWADDSTPDSGINNCGDTSTVTTDSQGVYVTGYTVTTQRQGQEQALPEKIDLNTATAAQLETLDGIGPKLAQRIIEDREANGPFASVEELDRVSGIGPATVENLRDFVTVEDGT